MNLRILMTILFVFCVQVVLGEVVKRDERGMLFEGATVSGSKRSGSREYVANELLLGIDIGLYTPSNTRGQWDGAERINSPILRRALDDYGEISIRRIFASSESGQPGENSGIPDLRGYVHIRFSRDIDVIGLAELLRRIPGVKFAEPNFFIELGDFTPTRRNGTSKEGNGKSFPNDTDDTYWDDQWNLNSGESDFSINASEAWAYTTGDSSVIIGVVEGRIDTTHADLAIEGGIHVYWNTPQTGGESFIDYIPIGSHPGDNPYRAHATQAAGIIRASTNNNVGVAGVAGGNGTSGGCSLFNVQIDNPADVAIAVAALEYAADPNGLNCDVLSCSWRFEGYSEALRGALAFCNSKGVNVITGHGYDDSQAVSDSLISMGGLDYSWVTSVGIYGTDGEVCHGVRCADRDLI